MTNTVTFDRPNYSNSDSLILALFVAILVHVAIAMTVKFSTPHADKISRSSIDVTIVQSPSKKAPKNAKFLAADNQEGAGTKVVKAKTPTQILPSVAERNDAHEEPISKIVAEQSEAQDIKHQAIQKTVVRHKSEKKIVSAEKAVDATHKEEERPSIDIEKLQQQIAQLGTEIQYNAKGSDDNKGAKTLAQVSAHRFVAAQYIKDWESKIEQTGNTNYPEIAAKKKFSTLTMDVGIKADGNIDSIHIRKSSGSPLLDEAAKKIVKMSAPFAPLPSSLLKELKILVITRKWKFSDESGMSTP